MSRVKITVITEADHWARRRLDAEMLVSLSEFSKPVDTSQAMLPDMVVALRGLADHIEATLGAKMVGSAAPLHQTLV